MQEIREFIKFPGKSYTCSNCGKSFVREHQLKEREDGLNFCSPGCAGTYFLGRSRLRKKEEKDEKGK